MKPAYLLILLTVGGLTAAFSSSSTSSSSTARTASGAASWEGEVTQVLEGDLIEVKGPDGKVTLRVEGVDCPDKGQEFAKIAKRFTFQAALRTTVRVEESGRDGENRIARIILSDGRNLSEELVRKGLAWWDRIRYPDNAGLAGLESQAKEHYEGLWIESDPLSPWDWRSRRPTEGDGAGVSGTASTVATSGALPVIQPTVTR